VKKNFDNTDYPIIIENEKIYTRNKYKQLFSIDNRILIEYVS
jgi:hypothetical protein